MNEQSETRLTETAEEPQSQATAEAEREPAPASASASATARTDRARSGSWLALLIAVLALGAGAYALHRADTVRDRLDDVRESVRDGQVLLGTLRSDLEALERHEQEFRQEVRGHLDELAALPLQVEELGRGVAELRSSSGSAQSRWSRAQVRFLLEVAQRSLLLERDVGTAIATLEVADERLAAAGAPEFAAVRQQIASELSALRALPQPDRAGMMARLASAERSVADLPLRAAVVTHLSTRTAESESAGAFARAWGVVKRAFSDLLTIRRLDDRSLALLTLEQETIARQHVALELAAARLAVMRADQPAYASALQSASEKLGEVFASEDSAVAALLDELAALAKIDVAPPLPDISGSASRLEQLSD